MKYKISMKRALNLSTLQQIRFIIEKLVFKRVGVNYFTQKNQFYHT